MKTKIQGFITYKQPEAWDTDDLGFRFFITDMKDYGYVVVAPHTIEFDLPEDFDPREKQVEILKAKKAKAMADFQALVTSIDKQISQLTALEFAA